MFILFDPIVFDVEVFTLAFGGGDLPEMIDGVIEIYSPSLVKLTQFEENELVSCVRTTALDQEQSLVFGVPQESITKADSLICRNVVGITTATYTDLYRIVRVDSPTSSSGEGIFKVTCDPLLNDLSSQIATFESKKWFTLKQTSPDAILYQLLLNTGFYYGSCPLTPVVDIEMHYRSVVDTLREIAEKCEKDLYTTVVGMSVFVHIGTRGETRLITLREERDGLEVNKLIQSDEFANKLFVYGSALNDAMPSSIQHAYIPVINKLGTLIYLPINTFAFEDDMIGMKGCVVKRLPAYMIHGVPGDIFTITDTTRSATADVMIINDSTKLWPGDQFVFLDSVLQFLDYVESSVSQAVYGVAEGTYEDGNVAIGYNFIQTPALDGIYTGGLCENWLDSSGVGPSHPHTFSECSDYTFIRAGTRSQKIETCASGDGVWQVRYYTSNMTSYYDTFDVGDYASCFVDLYVAAGTIEVMPYGVDALGVNAITLGTGWRRISIEGMRVNSPWWIGLRLAQFGAAACCFYLDFAQFEKGAYCTQEPLMGMEAVNLRSVAIQKLREMAEPKVIYDVSGKGEAYGILSAGDVIRVEVDDAIVSTRIQQVSQDLLMAQETSFSATNTDKRIQEIITRLYVEVQDLKVRNSVGEEKLRSHTVGKVVRVTESDFSSIKQL